MATKSEKTPLTPWICLISRLSMRYVGGEMNRMGFGPGQFFLLSELYTEEGLSQDELSRRVGVDKSNTSRALVKLEHYGLVQRKSDQQNHKVKKVFLKPSFCCKRRKVFNITYTMLFSIKMVICNSVHIQTQPWRIGHYKRH